MPEKCHRRVREIVGEMSSPMNEKARAASVEEKKS